MTNILYPNREYTESRESVPGGVRYSWFWSADGCSTRLKITNPTPEQLAAVRQQLKIKEAA